LVPRAYKGLLELWVHKESKVFKVFKVFKVLRAPRV
jgi:hypothetical protein